MKYQVIALLVGLAYSAELHAHFIWILPGGAEGAKATTVFFSDSLKADSPNLLKKIAGTRLFTQAGDGRMADLQKTEAGNVYKVVLSDSKCSVVRGVCRYGVVQRGSSPPFLLMYYPKAILPEMPPRGEPSHLDLASEATPLEIIPVHDKPGLFQVLWRQQPVFALEVTVERPGDDKSTTRQVDIDGMFSLEEGGKTPAGTYGMRVGYVDAAPGQHDGKAYKEVRHYATLVVRYPTR